MDHIFDFRRIAILYIYKRPLYGDQYITINYVGHHWKGFSSLFHMMYHVLHILNIGHFTTHFTNAPKLSQ